MRGARAPRTSGLTWAQGHNDPRPPGPAALPRSPLYSRPLPDIPSLGVCTKKKIPQDCAHGLGAGSGTTPFCRSKKTKTTEIKPNRRNKATCSGLNRCRGSGGLPTDLSGGHPRPASPGAAGHRDPNVAQALPDAVAPPAACHRWRLLVAGPGGQMHLGFFAPFLILIFKLCFLSRSALAGAGKAGGGPRGSRTCLCPAPPRPGTGR